MTCAGYTQRCNLCSYGEHNRLVGEMSNPNNAPESLKFSDRATLDLLVALESGRPETQRGLAIRIGAALGLTNSLLKRAVRKGLVKVQKVPAKRFAYFVTPKGFSEKSQLVAQYLSSSLSFFRRARSEYSEIFSQIKTKQYTQVALFGAGELAEIALLSAQEYQIEISIIIDPSSHLSHFVGIPVSNSLEDLVEKGVEAVILTISDNPQEAYGLVSGHFCFERVFVAPLLHVKREPNGDAET